MGAFPSAAAQSQPFDPFKYREQALRMQQQQQAQQIQGQQMAENSLDIQAKQRAAQDQQTTMQILAKYQGDLESALPELASHVSANTYLGLQKAALETKKSVAELDNKTLENNKLRTDSLLGLVSEAVKLPPDQYAQAWPTIVSRAAEIDPKVGQHLNPAQPVPPEQLAQYGSLFQTQSTALAKEAAQRAATKAQEDTAAAAAELPGKKAESTLKQEQAAAGGTADVDKFISNWLKDKNLPNTAANWSKAHKAYTDETKTDPGIARAIAFASNRPVQIIDPNNPNQVKFASAGEAIKTGAESPQSIPYQAEKGVVKSFTSGKDSTQLTAFNTAITHLSLLDKLGADLNNTDLQVVNKAKQAWATQTGSAAPANFDAAKNAMAGEVAAALKASGATDQEIAKVDSTFSKAQGPAQLKGAINTYRQLLTSKAQVLKQKFEQGSQGKPNFGTQETPANDPFSAFGGKTRQ